MRNLLGICVILILANPSILPSVSGQDTSDYLTVQMLQGVCWYTISREAGYVVAQINDAFGIDMITTLTCKLTIQAPAKNQGVIFQFTSFNVTESVDCVDDSVLLFDGDDTSSPELTPENGLCGDFNPGSYMSSGDSLTVLFFTDQLGDGYPDYDYTSSFQATWTAYQGIDDGDDSSSYSIGEPVSSDDLFCCETSDACIDLKFACDGVRNCDDGSDEGPAACTVDYGLFGSLEILAVVLVALALVTAVLAFVAFVTCFCRSICKSKDEKRLLESTEFIYQRAGSSDLPPVQGSTEYLMERTEMLRETPRSFPGGVPRPAEVYTRPQDTVNVPIDQRSRQYLRRQASLEDRSRNVDYSENAALDEASRSLLLSNFSWRLPRPQVQESLVRSRSMESIVSYGQWDNFWLRQRVTDDETEAESIQFGINPYEVIHEPNTLYVNEPYQRTAEETGGGRRARSFRTSHRRSRSLSPSGRVVLETEAVSRDPLSPDEEWHVGRSPADYEQLANINRTHDVPRFFLSGPTPSMPGSEV